MKKFFLIISFVVAGQFSFCLEKKLWHSIEREIRYTPEGNDFVIVNGNRRFTRALYGTNTAFRVEAGDRSEFLINAEKITACYRPGSMLLKILF